MNRKHGVKKIVRKKAVAYSEKKSGGKNYFYHANRILVTEFRLIKYATFCSGVTVVCTFLSCDAVSKPTQNCGTFFLIRFLPFLYFKQ